MNKPAFREDASTAQKTKGIARAWERTDDKDPNTSDLDQDEAKRRSAQTQEEWNRRGAPTPNNDRLATPRKLEAWERPTDGHLQNEKSDAKDRADARDEVPAHILAQCPPGRRPVKRADGGYTFELVSSGTRADAKTKVTRFG